MESVPDPSTAPAGALPGRRSLFRWLTGGLGALASLAVGVPFFGCLLGVGRREVEWVDLGAVDDFPPDETRLVNFDNPIRQPWDGLTAHIGVFVRNQGEGSDEKDRFLV